MKVSKFAKFLVAAVTAGAIALNETVLDGVIDNGELITIALAVLGALGVYQVPNSTDGQPSSDRFQ